MILATADTGAAALSLFALAAALVVGAIVVVAARLRAKTPRDLRNLPWFLVVFACAVACLVTSWVVRATSFSKTLRLRDEGAEVVEKRLLGDVVVGRVAKAEARRVVVFRWKGSTSKNVPFDGATVYVETSAKPREAAIDVRPALADEVGQRLAAALGVPVTRIP